jgi:glycosyltransferase involved in cell wall biosynthesis
MSTHSNTILVASHVIPYPPAHGVCLRILKLLKWLNGEGYRVILVMPADSIDANALAELRKVTFAVHWTKPALRTRIVMRLLRTRIGGRFPFLRKMLWETPKRLHTDRDVGGDHLSQVHSFGLPNIGDYKVKRGLCPENLVSLVGKLARKYKASALIAETIFLTPCFNALPPDTLKLVDTHDVFSQKPEQVLVWGIHYGSACTKEEERGYLLQADAIIAIQSREAKLLRSLVPEREVILVGMEFAVTGNEPANVGNPDSIAMIASDNPLNVHGLRRFLAECWPQIKAAQPTATLHVVGRVGDACQLDNQAIRYSRWIPTLAEVYKDARVIINPAIAGTGLKIKSAEALAHGKPLVAWTNGVEGLDYIGSPPYIECRSWKEFADAVVRLLQSTNEAEKLSARALAYATEVFDVVAVYAPLKVLLEKRLNSKHSANQQKRRLYWKKISRLPCDKRRKRLNN